MMASPLLSRKLLVVGLNFNNYDTMIVAELRRLGYEVEQMTYKGAVPIRKLFRTKFAVWVFYWLVCLATLPKRFYFLVRILARISSNGITAVIAVNPSFLMFQCLPPSVRRKTAVWLMDPVTLYPQNARFLKGAGYRFTYDPDDAKSFNATFLPLFADMQLYGKSQPSGGQRRYLFAFVGALYANRAAILERLSAIAAEKRREVYFAGDFVRLTNVAQDLAAGQYPHLQKVFIHRRHTHQEIVEVYKEADFIVNVHQVGHQGLSMRTFEALALGCTQIIDIYRPDEFPFNRYPVAFRNLPDFVDSSRAQDIDQLLINKPFSVADTDVSLTSRLEIILKAFEQ